MTPWLYVGAAALAFGAGWQVNEWRWDSKESSRLSAELAQAQENQRLTRVAVDKNRSVTDAYLAREKARTAAANATVVSLRNEIAAATGPIDPATRPDFDGERIALLGRLLAESVELAEEGRRRLEGAASKVDALHAYIREVSVIGSK